ncbi:hypothetical protein NDU88_002840 [Pleurodeles waltl]|uniref:Breast cancer anti-estrogen resistance protein 3 n=3 Tax=Pleurodeles waltl TaxID=8319 RepID=A0AAV7T3P7_PLEWA|nr:hypothetical protein NDU88_002840 [Pleurodeles waltl]
MDLLSSKSRHDEHPQDAYQDVCIHGTLPRKKKGAAPVRAYDMFGYMGTLPFSKAQRVQTSLMQDVIEEYPPKDKKPERPSFRDQSAVDPAVEYVKFSRERYIMDGGTPEKLRKELEEELKLSSDDLRSHAWYHGRIPRQVSENLLQRDGDFLIRDSLSSPGNFVLTCQWKNTPQHFKINKVVVRLNEAYSRIQYQFERESFDNVPALVRFYVGNRKSVSEQSGAIIFQPINRTVPLRCTEEKYGVSPVRHRECNVPDGKTETPKRLSLNICKVPSPEHTLLRGNLLRNKEKSGSQPACLDHVQEKRRPLKAHQSESYLSIGSRFPSPSPGVDTRLSPASPVYRSGSEPALSPVLARRFTYEADVVEALRGSDSQLCPKPPPKPSKVPTMQPQHSPAAHRCSEHTDKCELNADCPTDCGVGEKPSHQVNGCTEQKTQEDSAQVSSRTFEHSSLTPEESTSTSSLDPLSERGADLDEFMFVRPVFETSSSFQPSDFQSTLLPSENKPLETSVLKRVKEFFTNNDPKTIAKHILRMDCKVARILEVSAEVRRMMGVSSGLELITLPYGHQLRLDLIERHSTMAIGIAVDILGCTGNLEERTTTLNKIIQVAVELKDFMGDLYAFSAVMKALDMPQITRLEQTWTSLRHQYTQNAIIYEKQLKPFSKALHTGEETAMTPPNITIPLLIPLITLLEREDVIFEGMDMWENNDQGCEIMLNHLHMARSIAQNAETYRLNAEKILEGFRPDEEMSDIFRTEFQMRLLWGSKGAQVNQRDRYEKFSQILSALSRKLEASVVKHLDLDSNH